MTSGNAQPNEPSVRLSTSSGPSAIYGKATVIESATNTPHISTDNAESYSYRLPTGAAFAEWTVQHVPALKPATQNETLTGWSSFRPAATMTRSSALP